MSKNSERDLQDILDEMTDAQKDLQALIVAASVEDQDLSGNPEVVAQYDSLSPEVKRLIDFVVGNVLADEEKYVAHSELDVVGGFLAHYGVKGMKWGVRNNRRGGSSRLSSSSANTSENRASARARVSSGKATLGDAHLASLKSKGHRVVNGFSGDKNFWRNMAITAGVSTAGVATSFAMPFILPAGALASVGSAVGGAAGAFGHVKTMADVGSLALFSAGLYSTGVGAAVATAGNVVTNTGRAIRGNARIDKSFAALGRNMVKRQTNGSERVRKILNKTGSIDKRDLTHMDLVNDFLAHHGLGLNRAN